MPDPRRFASPGLLLGAYAAHQHTRDRLRKLLDDAEDEQHALDREMAELLRHFPHGIRDGDSVFFDLGGPESPSIAVRKSPVEIYDLDTWADVEEWGLVDVPDNAPIGPGPDAPSFTVPAGDGDAGGADDYGMTEPFDPVPPSADCYPADESLSLAGIEVRDDDGDDL